MAEAQQQDLAEQIKTQRKVNHEQIQLQTEEDHTTLKTRITVAPTYLQEPKTVVDLTLLAQALQEVAVVATAVAEAEDQLEAEAEVVVVKMCNETK